MTKQLLSALKVATLALVLSFGISYALAWVGPTAQPPSGNVAAPINIGATSQTKIGTLAVGALTSVGPVTAPNLIDTSATPQTKIGGDICTTVAGVTKCLQTVGGDNLGNHTATQALNMAGNSINSANTVDAASSRATLWNQTSEGGVLTLTGADGVKMHLEVLSGGLFRLINSPWNAQLYSVDQSGNINQAGSTYQGGNLNANDVYSRAAGKWMSQMAVASGVTSLTAGTSITLSPAGPNATGAVTVSAVGSVNVYQCPAIGGGVCPSTCVGQLSPSASCSYAVRSSTGICMAAPVRVCTYIGKLMP